jgi:Zn-dependent M16 (insulinase) family peptidase
MVARFKTKADQFSNSDLLDYMKAVQGAIDTSSKNLSQIEEPPTIVQQNNTQINVNVVDSFDRDARERILAAIQATLKTAQQPIVVDAESTEEKSIPQVDVDSAIEELNSSVDVGKETS